jgi:hypothetical protein
MIGLQWLYLHVADPIRDKPTQRLGTRHLESGGLVLHRTPNAFVTLSYGAKVMGQIAAMRPDRIVSPDQRSLIGGVYPAGEQRPPNPHVSAVDVDVKDDRFTAKLTVDHGPSIRANLAFRTDFDGTLYVHEELMAVKDVTVTRVATAMIGVLNNKQWIYETGHRTITLDDESTVIPAHSGKVLAGEACRIVIDDAMTILSDTPLRVRYVASTGPERGRATDRLYLNYADESKIWKADETISRYDLAIRVGR